MTILLKAAVVKSAKFQNTQTYSVLFIQSGVDTYENDLVVKVHPSGEFLISGFVPGSE